MAARVPRKHGVPHESGDSRRKGAGRRQGSPRVRIAERLAANQHGVVARRQLLATGESTEAIDHRLRDGRWQSVHRGVYAPGHQQLTQRGYWLAAVLAVGPDSVLSLRDAGALRGVRSSPRSRIDVTSPRRARSRRGIEVHQGRLHPDDITVIDGIPVTSWARTMLDLAEVLRPDDLQRVWEQSERMELIHTGALNAVVQRNPGRHGLRHLLPLLDLNVEVEARTKSPLEGRFRDLLRREGLPLPAPNVVVEGFEVDGHWPGTKMIVEIDSWTFHRSRRSFQEDRRRTLTLQVAGYEVLRITDELMKTPELIVSAIVSGLPDAK